MTVPWNDVDTVLLDMDGTLLDLHYDNYFWQRYLFQRYALAEGVSEESVRAWLLPKMHELRGTLEWYCLEFWSRLLGRDVGRYKEEVADRIGWRPGAREFLEAVGKSGKRRVLVTNAHPRVVDLKFRRTGLDRHLDAVITAHDFRRPKEDAGFWTALGEAEPFDPSRSVLFDDNAAALAKAREYGIERLYGIVRPDLRAEPLRWDDFPAVEDFDAFTPKVDTTAQPR